MLGFHMGTLIFQLVVFLIFVAILALVSIGVIALIKRSNTNKSLEKQNEEILKQLAEIKEKQGE